MFVNEIAVEALLRYDEAELPKFFPSQTGAWDGGEKSTLCLSPSRADGLRRHALPDAPRPVPVRAAEQRNEI